MMKLGRALTPSPEIQYRSAVNMPGRKTAANLRYVTQAP